MTGSVKSWTARLAELGIRLPPVAAPVAAYVPAVRSGQLVFTSGQRVQHADLGVGVRSGHQ
jgi:enamine deaminase RidA (YjgF/YER057c/UK114 family)